MKNWEYKVLKLQTALYSDDELQKTLNEYGRTGWELVNIIPQYSSSSNMEDQLEELYLELNVLVFKRER